MRISDWSSDVCSSDLLFERLQHLPYGPVDFHDDVAVQSPFGFALEFVGYSQRHVGHAMGEVEKKGLVFIPLDEIDSPLGILCSEQGLLVDRIDDRRSGV